MTLAGGVAGEAMAMHAMPMGGMSMAWMRMPGQSWPGAAAAFVALWTPMMVAMMLPSLLPMLARYRDGILGARAHAGAGTGSRPPAALAAVAAMGYSMVWAFAGFAVFPVGAALATLQMHSPLAGRIAQLAAGAVVVAAGALQFSAWKSRQLDACRRACWCGPSPPTGAGGAFLHGMRLGVRCCSCCAGLTASLLVVGVMDPSAMAAATVAITLERLWPAGGTTPRVTGAFLVVAGMLLAAC